MEPLRGRIDCISAKKPWCTVSHIMVMSLRSKWAAGKARGGRISQSIRNRRATRPPAHFQRNPPGRGRLAVFPRCSLDPYESRYGALRSRLEKQPTDLRRHHHYMRDGALDHGFGSPKGGRFITIRRPESRRLILQL